MDIHKFEVWKVFVIYDAHYIIISVPKVSSPKPAADFFVSFSRKTIRENAIVTRILSLSIGTMTLAGPSRRAR